MIGQFGRQGPAAILRQHCPQMTRRRCKDIDRLKSSVAGCRTSNIWTGYCQKQSRLAASVGRQSTLQLHWLKGLKNGSNFKAGLRLNRSASTLCAHTWKLFLRYKKDKVKKRSVPAYFIFCTCPPRGRGYSASESLVYIQNVKVWPLCKHFFFQWANP